jgi:hypothetical protein
MPDAQPKTSWAIQQPKNIELGGQGPQLLNNRITNIEHSNIEVKIFRKRIPMDIGN